MKKLRLLIEAWNDASRKYNYDCNMRHLKRKEDEKRKQLRLHNEKCFEAVMKHLYEQRTT